MSSSGVPVDGVRRVTVVVSGEGMSSRGIPVDRVQRDTGLVDDEVVSSRSGLVDGICSGPVGLVNGGVSVGGEVVDGIRQDL